MTEEEASSPPSKWRENHGNFLIGFVGLVLVIGAGLVVYRQNQSHSSQSPPDVRRRPDAYTPSIDTPEVSNPVEVTDPSGDGPPGENIPAETPAEAASDSTTR